MAIYNVTLTNFRNFKNKSLSFSKATTVVVGPNAIGKTNILEAIHLLSTGKSFRAGVEAEMVLQGVGIARVIGEVGEGNEKTKLEAVLVNGSGGEFGKVEEVKGKRLLVNGVAKRLVDFVGNLRTVLFGPWDMNLVSGSPSLRRGFLDSMLSQVDSEYRRSLLSYEKGLRQRNRILWDLREASVFGTASRERLHFWDKLLIKNGDYITKERENFINFANTEGAGLAANFRLIYDKSAISETRLKDYEKEEIAAAQTLVGPHRDDIKFSALNTDDSKTGDLASFGSRGEQRMGVLWLKLRELAFIEEKSGERPTLLLDDIFSELDHNHRDLVMKVVNHQQTIITTADEHFVEDLPQSSIIKLYGDRK